MIVSIDKVIENFCNISNIQLINQRINKKEKLSTSVSFDKWIGEFCWESGI